MSIEPPPGRAPDELELLAYADGRLDAASARGRELGAWLDTHPAARQRVRAYAQQDRDIRAHFAQHYAAPLPPQLRLQGLRRRQQRRARWTIATAAALVVAMATGWTLVTRSADVELEQFAREVALQLDSDAVADADAMTPAPDDAQTAAFMPAGFALVGQRQRASASGPLTEQIYRDAAGRSLHLFVGEEIRAAPVQPHRLRSGGQLVVYWESDARRYALTGGVSEPELHALAALALHPGSDAALIAAHAPAADEQEPASLALPASTLEHDAQALMAMPDTEMPVLLHDMQPLPQNDAAAPPPNPEPLL